MRDPRDDIIQGQDKLMLRYEEALEGLMLLVGTKDMVSGHRVRAWVSYGLAGGKAPSNQTQGNR